jgi:hypothetical protein
VLAAQHLLGLGGVHLLFKGIQRLDEIGGDVLATLRPFDQHADVVDLLRQAGAQLAVLGEASLALQRLLRFGLVVPEGRRGDLLFQLG